MKDIDYTKAIEIYERFLEKASSMKEAYDAAMTEAYGAGSDKVFDNPFSATPWLQVYVEQPSKDAVYSFENETSTFYTLLWNGFEVSEVVRKETE